MHRIVLNDQEIAAVQALLGTLCARYRSAEDADFIARASLYAHELPRQLRAFLNDFRLHEPASVAVIAGYPIDDHVIGPTPPHWQAGRATSQTLAEELWLVLCASLLGEVFGWSTQQAGRLVHDILPIRGHEHEQMGSSSSEVLWWHTEEAFHPCKCDYLGLMCLRNPDRVGTTVAPIESIAIPAAHAAVLAQPRFRIRPDDAHFQKNRVVTGQLDDTTERLLAQAYERIQQMQTDPQRVPVLFGDPQSPYLCIDPYYMERLDDDPPAQMALEALRAAIDASLTKVVLCPGDICFIDNYRAVHGREAFRARFDGTDRWLKRINVTRDLRKSRALRAGVAGRVIF